MSAVRDDVALVALDLASAPEAAAVEAEPVAGAGRPRRSIARLEVGAAIRRVAVWAVALSCYGASAGFTIGG